MIEILLIWLLSRWVAKVAQEKGHRRGPFILLTIALWIGAEFTGAIIGAAIIEVNAISSQAVVYLFALAGAALGAGAAYLITTTLSPVTPEISPRPLAGLTRWLALLLKVGAGVAGAGVLISVYSWLEYTFPPRHVNPNEVWLTSDVLGTAQVVLEVALSIITAITFLRWTYRADANLHRLAPEQMKISPGWAVGWYFVPIAFLWKPYQAMREIWDAAHRDPASNKEVLRWWWILWLLSWAMAEAVTARLSSLVWLGEGQATAVAGAVTGGFDILLALVALRLIVTVARAYEQNYAGAVVLPAMAPATAGTMAAEGTQVPVMESSNAMTDVGVMRPVGSPDSATGVGQMKPVRKRAIWPLVAGIVAVLVVAAAGALLYLFNLSIDETRALAPWPGPGVSAVDVASLDLASLGMHPEATRDVRQIYGADAPFVDGAAIEYGTKGNGFVVVAALHYSSSADASGHFSSLAGWAAENCGWSAEAHWLSQGVIRCDYRDGHDRILWSGEWILDIAAGEMGDVAPRDLVNKVRDAAAAHWRASVHHLSQPWYA